MDKNNNEALFDEILTKAFFDSVEEEIAECEKEYSGECGLSDEHIKEERREYKKAQRRATRKAVPRWVLCGKVAAFVLTIGIIGKVLTLCIPDVQADYASMTMTYYDEYIYFESSHTVYDGPQIKYSFNYLPEGFRQTVYDEFPYHNSDLVLVHLHYIIDDMYPYIDIDYGRNGNLKYYCDTEKTIVETVDINGNVGYLIDRDGGGLLTLLWNDGINSFYVTTTISAEETLKFARGIVRCEDN